MGRVRSHISRPLSVSAGLLACVPLRVVGSMSLQDLALTYLSTNPVEADQIVRSRLLTSAACRKHLGGISGMAGDDKAAFFKVGRPEYCRRSSGCCVVAKITIPCTQLPIGAALQLLFA